MATEVAPAVAPPTVVGSSGRLTGRLKRKVAGWAGRAGMVAGMSSLLAMSLLPLSALLLVLPAVMPEETVLTDTNPRSRSRAVRLAKRLFALVVGGVALLALVLFAVELVGWLPLKEKGYFGGFFRLFFPEEFVAQLPPALVQHWPYVVLVTYALDVGLLLAIGKVPVAYNVRNLMVRWRITLLTALAFTVLVGLLACLLAFVNGMDHLTESSGVPGNVIVLSDGSTDEIFSNLGYDDTSNIQRETVSVDQRGRPLPAPVGVKKVRLGNRDVALFSEETYCVGSQAVPNPKPGAPARRFISVRGVMDAEVAAAVHNLELLPGGRWFDAGSGVRPALNGGGNWIEVVVGEGVAGTLGADLGKKRLEPGDTFKSADRTWVVVGVMKAEGSTFGSEVWAKQSLVGETFRKTTYTTVVLRVSDDSAAGAAAMAYHLRTNYTASKLKTQTEQEYYTEQSKTNQFFLGAIIVVAVVMAVGGVFGVMNTMFAAIAQRTKDIGVLRLIGFKRWQVLVSFMLESLGIALIGGVLGCAAGSLSDGFTATSLISSGQGGPARTVILRMTVTSDVIMVGMLFTLVMGRLGGLVPALSAMRLKILESLR